MSEQDKKSGGGSGGSVVMVDKSSSSRHKPYRPTELQEEPAPDLHKRSKAPAVPSVAEVLKDATNTEPAAVERVEPERAMTSEKHMHVPKNKSTDKRRGSSPDNLKMVPLDSAGKDMIASSPTPIPAQVEKVSDEATEKVAAKVAEKKAEEDSITDEITELRTPEAVAKEHSEWNQPTTTIQPTNSTSIKKKEISWKDSEYLDKVRLEEDTRAKATRCQSIFRDLNVKSQAAILERKPSIGPCCKPSMLYGGPSGITICVPKKSVRTMKEEFNPIQSVIDFNLTKKEVSKSTSHVNSSQCSKKLAKKMESEVLKIDSDQQHIKFLGVLRTKLDNMSSRIRNLLNM